jgi:apolipoprotein N-acyltransferase
MNFLLLFALAGLAVLSILKKKPWLAAIACGLGLGLVSPPNGFWWLHWVLWVPVLILLQPGQNKANFKLGYLTGLVGLATCFFWISESITLYSNLPKILALIAVLLFAAVYALPIAVSFVVVRPLRQHFPRAWILLAPAVAVATEFAPLALDQLTGVRLSLFPYFQGATQYRVLPSVQIASVAGIIMLTFLVYMTNCAVAECFFRRQEGRAIPWRIPAAAFGIVLVNAGWGALRIERVETEVSTWPTARLSQLQQDLTMDQRVAIAKAGAEEGDGGLTKLKRVSNTIKSRKNDLLLKCEKSFCTWQHLNGKILKRKEQMDLVVLPEGSILQDPQHWKMVPLLKKEAKKSKAPILLGAGYRDRKLGTDHNSIFLFDENGLIDHYNKMILLPFGEFIPFSQKFPILKKWIQGPGDFTPGTSAVAFEIAAKGDRPGFRFYTPVCYEAIIPHFMRRHMSDADLLINVTNDGWFGDTMAPHQHAMLAVARTIELGIPMYRLGFTGVSLTATPTGEISNETAAFERVSRVVEVPVGQLPTFYKRFGDWFGWGCTLLSLGLWGFVRRRSVTPAPPLA